MQRLHWTLDLHEAEIVAGLMRSHGIDAFVFNEGIARMAWHQALAYGGFRVMVNAHQWNEAVELFSAWRQGQFALPDEEPDVLACPRCAATDIQKDERRRGWTFVILMLFSLPMPWRWQRRVHCLRCDHRWNRNTIEPPGP